MRFWKIEGAGNDFVVVDESAAPVVDAASLAVALSDRRRGVGADGLLLLSRSRERGVDAEMRIVNSDGSPALMCGNGLRGVVRWLLESGRAAGAEVVVRTPVGLRRGRLEPSGEVAVSMGVPSFDPAALPCDLPVGEPGLPCGHPLPEGLLADPDVAFAVSVGNPHLVVRVPDAGATDLAHARALSLSPRLRDGANVHFVTPQRAGPLRTVTWERGAGPTPACGSGAVAVAAVARALAWCEAAAPVRVAMPGGTLTVAFDAADEAWLAGPARVVFAGEWPET